MENQEITPLPSLDITIDRCFACTCDLLRIIDNGGRFDPGMFHKVPSTEPQVDAVAEICPGEGSFVHLACWDRGVRYRAADGFRPFHHDTIVVGVASLAGYADEITHWGCGVYFGPRNANNFHAFVPAAEHKTEDAAAVAAAVRALEVAAEVERPWPCNGAMCCKLRNVVIKTTSKRLAAHFDKVYYSYDSPLSHYHIHPGGDVDEWEEGEGNDSYISDDDEDTYVWGHDDEEDDDREDDDGEHFYPPFRHLPAYYDDEDEVASEEGDEMFNFCCAQARDGFRVNFNRNKNIGNFWRRSMLADEVLLLRVHGEPTDPTERPSIQSLTDGFSRYEEEEGKAASTTEETEESKLETQIRHLAEMKVMVSCWLVGRGKNDEAFSLAAEGVRQGFQQTEGE